MADSLGIKRKNGRSAINLETKYKIIQDKLAGMKTQDIKVKYNLKNDSNVSRILSNQQAIVAAYQGDFGGKRKSLKTTNCPELEARMMAFIIDMNEKALPVSAELLIEKTKKECVKLGIKDLKVSRGFVQKFQERKMVSLIQLHGEANNVPDYVVEDWNVKIAALTDGFEAKNISNIDEFGFFYSLLPSKTLAAKVKKCRKGKHSKVRITVLIGSNSDGSDKMKLLVIGKAKAPISLRPLIRNRTLPVLYRNNSKAWLTGDIFKEHLFKVNAQMQK